MPDTNLIFSIEKIEYGTPTGLATMPSILAAPTAPTAGTPTAGGSVTAGTHSYKVTLVASDGETTPSVKSSVITAVSTSGQTVPLTDIPIGGAGTTARKIYRTVAGDTGDWKLLATIADNTTTTFSDTIADGSLGVSAPTANTTTGLIEIAKPVKGSVKLDEAAVTTTKKYREGVASPAIIIPGEEAVLTITAQFFDFNFTDLAAFKGGTVTAQNGAVGETYEPDETVLKIDKAFTLTAASGHKIHVYNGFVNARVTGNLTREDLLTIEVTIEPQAIGSKRGWKIEKPVV